MGRPCVWTTRTRGRVFPKRSRNAARGKTLEHRPGAVRHHPTDRRISHSRYHTARYGLGPRQLQPPRASLGTRFLPVRRAHTQSLPFLVALSEKNTAVVPYPASPHCNMAPAPWFQRVQRRRAHASVQPTHFEHNQSSRMRASMAHPSMSPSSPHSGTEAQSSSFLSPLVLPLGSKISSMRPYSLA
jgi:hypothetical protein